MNATNKPIEELPTSKSRGEIVAVTPMRVHQFKEGVSEYTFFINSAIREKGYHANYRDLPSQIKKFRRKL